MSMFITELHYGVFRQDFLDNKLLFSINEHAFEEVRKFK
jgi:hypothetical protein